MTTIDISVSDGANDGHAHAWDSTNTYVTIGRTGASNYNPFFLFNNVTIPNKSVITTAYITLVSTVNRSDTQVKVDFYGNYEDTATAPTSDATFDALNTTTATVHWEPGNVTLGTAYNTPEIKAIVQEIVDRTGWATGNKMMVIGKGTSSGTANIIRNYASYENTSYNQPVLHVEFVPPGSGVAAVYLSDYGVM